MVLLGWSRPSIHSERFIHFEGWLVQIAHQRPPRFELLLVRKIRIPQMPSKSPSTAISNITNIIAPFSYTQILLSFEYLKSSSWNLLINCLLFYCISIWLIKKYQLLILVSRLGQHNQRRNTPTQIGHDLSVKD
jgi:hypothetical protein